MHITTLILNKHEVRISFNIIYLRKSCISPSQLIYLAAFVAAIQTLFCWDACSGKNRYIMDTYMSMSQVKKTEEML